MGAKFHGAEDPKRKPSGAPTWKVQGNGTSPCIAGPHADNDRAGLALTLRAGGNVRAEIPGAEFDTTLRTRPQDFRTATT